MHLKDEIRTEISKIISNDDRVLSSYLLGSLVNGNFNDKSDIDIALMLYSEMDMDSMELLEVSTFLTMKFGRTVDLGLLSTNNLIYASEVLYKGELLFTKSENKNNLIRANLLGLYLNFNEDRKEVLDAYRA